jgi:hypothetical protein
MLDTQDLSTQDAETLDASRKAISEYLQEQGKCDELSANLRHCRQAAEASRKEAERLRQEWSEDLREALGVQTDAIRSKAIEAAALIETAGEQDSIAAEIEGELIDQQFSAAAKWRAYCDARGRAHEAYATCVVEQAYEKLLQTPEARELLGALLMLRGCIEEEVRHSPILEGHPVVTAVDQRLFREGVNRKLHKAIVEPFIDTLGSCDQPQLPEDVASALREVKRHPSEGALSERGVAQWDAHKKRKASAAA